MHDENELRGAIKAGELTVHYQSIVAVADGRLVSIEALIRWQHPKRGLIAPGDFIPLAEEASLIVPMGDLVLEQVCCDASAWQARNGDAPPPGIAVNVSARQLADRSLADKSPRPWTAWASIPGAWSSRSPSPCSWRKAISLTSCWRRCGHVESSSCSTTSGTGYSSLSYLERLPLDALKIDRSFANRLEESGRGARIVAAIIELARGLDLTVVAEGVETELQLETLRKLGCPLAQGFYFARPMPAEEIARLLSHAARRAGGPGHG